VDQHADAGDEQHERQRQRVDPEPEVDLQRADRDPRVQLGVRGGARVGREEQDQAVDEGEGDGGTAEQMPPGLGPLTRQQQDQRAEAGEGHQQPR
jgi:hypothetical protein